MLELFQRSVGIALGQGVQRLLFLGLGLRLLGAGHVLVEKFAHLALGQRAGETVHGLTVHQQHAGGDTADAEHGGELLLLVGVDLGQLETARVVGFQLLQHRPERLAGAAPGRPEIHQHRHVHGGGDDLGFKVFYGDVDHSMALPRHRVAKSKIPGSHSAAGGQRGAPHLTL
ncbi:hypothetical protein SDC9_193631 [bioreactor metagenome]|uniref:Uncharacterized protein n=1 Tax=bioreactor metagenome TaxID=1076179 RepID=A0A645I434_9ZZZZ